MAWTNMGNKDENRDERDNVIQEKSEQQAEILRESKEKKDTSSDKAKSRKLSDMIRKAIEDKSSDREISEEIGHLPEEKNLHTVNSTYNKPSENKNKYLSGKKIHRKNHSEERFSSTKKIAIKMEELPSTIREKISKIEAQEEIKKEEVVKTETVSSTKIISIKKEDLSIEKKPDKTEFSTETKNLLPEKKTEKIQIKEFSAEIEILSSEKKTEKIPIKEFSTEIEILSPEKKTDKTEFSTEIKNLSREKKIETIPVKNFSTEIEILSPGKKIDRRDKKETLKEIKSELIAYTEDKKKTRHVLKKVSEKEKKTVSEHMFPELNDSFFSILRSVLPLKVLLPGIIFVMLVTGVLVVGITQKEKPSIKHSAKSTVTEEINPTPTLPKGVIPISQAVLAPPVAPCTPTMKPVVQEPLDNPYEKEIKAHSVK